MNLYDQIEPWLTTRAQNPVHRQLLMICGQEDWAIEQAKKIIKQNPFLWLGNHNQGGDKTTNQQYQNKLGQEFDYAVVNCYSGFKANASLAVSGTVKKYGLMIMLCPELHDWPTFNDPEWSTRVSYGFDKQLVKSRFIEKFVNLVTGSAHVALFTRSQFRATVSFVAPKYIADELSAVAEQKKAVERIIKVAIGHRNRPLVLSADRGRGKSSALGIAAAFLIKQKHKKIGLLAPSPDMVTQVFSHAKQALPEANFTKNKLSYEQGYLHYIAPDAIISNQEEIDLLLIDEAAALPVHLLFKLIDRYPRLVFSTTLHGYEGSGRGFEIRVKDYLNKSKPNWHNLKLSRPHRWYPDDCLESFWFEALNMQNDQDERIFDIQKAITFTYVSQTELAENPATTNCIFQLLIDAHYQTSPDDLIRLLDAPEQHCFLLKQAEMVIGVALIIEEGGEKLAPLYNEIAAGTRRVKGHLNAQNLSFHYADAEFCQLKQWRLSRLVIKKEYQGRGLGHVLIHHVISEAQNKNIDLLSTSFGMTKRLLNFWTTVGFKLVNLSKKPEVSSAEHSAQLIYPIATQSQLILNRFEHEFCQELIFHCDKAFADFPPLLIHQILMQLPLPEQTNAKSADMLKHFMSGSRPLANCTRILRQVYFDNIKQINTLDNQTIQLLIATLVQVRPFHSVCQQLNVTGKKQIEQLLRNGFQQMTIML